MKAATTPPKADPPVPDARLLELIRHFGRTLELPTTEPIAIVAILFDRALGRLE